MADQYIQVQPNSTGLKVDTSEIVVGANTVERQRVVIGDASAPASLARVDAAGNLSAGAGYGATVSGTITSATSTVAATVSGFSHVGISISGTHAGINLTFEFSDDGGTTWFAMQMTRSDSSVVEASSGVLTSNSSRAWDTTVPSCTTFRVRATAWTSGSGAIRIIPSAFPCVYNVAGNLRITDGTATNFLPTMDAVARRGYIGVTDGVSSAAVKAASTAAVAADPALVVQIHPTSPAHPVTQSGVWNVSAVPTTAGGLLSYHLISLATANANLVLTGARQLYNVVAFNTSASVRFLKIFNKATAPVAGTDTPVLTFLIPVTNSGVVIEFTNGVALSLGLGIAITALMADLDTTVVVAGDVLVNIAYK